jgi:hypothetical protein
VDERHVFPEHNDFALDAEYHQISDEDMDESIKHLLIAEESELVAELRLFIKIWGIHGLQ